MVASIEIPECAWVDVTFYFIDDDSGVVAEVKAGGAQKLQGPLAIPPSPNMLGYTFRPMSRAEIIESRKEDEPDGEGLDDD